MLILLHRLLCVYVGNGIKKGDKHEEDQLVNLNVPQNVLPRTTDSCFRQLSLLERFATTRIIREQWFKENKPANMRTLYQSFRAFEFFHTVLD